MILRLEELEFLLYTVQSLQDCELERLARLQGDLHRKNKREDEEDDEDDTQTLRCAGVCVCMLACARVCMHECVFASGKETTHCFS